MAKRLRHGGRHHLHRWNKMAGLKHVHRHARLSTVSRETTTMGDFNLPHCTWTSHGSALCSV
ncbi:hypothetical protein E2C01_052316 [Portunus trituberculatus]|uniref:Uncharacterized protein n=1 Tax=Portunus trituberculatus TaxID=210409 RepID=A0A5B7GMN8_PORTR|nr:hypothetical protein [Portunus trituberculatus]